MNNINEMHVPITVTELGATVDITVVEGELLPYFDGPYEVTPKVSEIVLGTKNKSMADDVTIFQIPYSEVSNPQGGYTVTIGIE